MCPVSKARNKVLTGGFFQTARGTLLSASFRTSNLGRHLLGAPPPPPSRPPKVERTQRGRHLACSKAFPGSTKHKGRFLRLLFSKGIRHLSRRSAAQVSPSVVLCLRLRCTHPVSASWSSRNLGGSRRMCHLNDRRQVTGRSVV